MSPEDSADARDNASRPPADLRRTDALAWAGTALAAGVLAVVVALIRLACR